MIYKELLNDEGCKQGAIVYVSLGLMTSKYRVQLVHSKTVFATKFDYKDEEGQDLEKIPDWYNYFFDEIEAHRYNIDYLKKTLASEEEIVNKLEAASHLSGNGF